MADGNPGPTPNDWLYSPWQRQVNEDILALANALGSLWASTNPDQQLTDDYLEVIGEIIERRTPQEGAPT